MIEEPPNLSPFQLGKGINPSWANFFSAAYRILNSLTQSGTTANRPTTILWIGRRYYDTTLSKPIWVNQVTPSIVWKDAAGVTV